MSPTLARTPIQTHDLRRLLPAVRTCTLANGLTLALVPQSGKPVVATALAFRAGTRDDPAGQGGLAHFLEHMMFRGAARYGAGEIDRITLAQGGSNNAFTSHDMTLYYFTFAADRWQQALDIEGDRMAGLTLAEGDVAGERQVIAEEIAMYEGEPWDALEQAVAAAAFPGHPYGRPILGTRSELAAIDAAALAQFHDRYYRPANAVLVLAGGIGEDALERVEASFGGLTGAVPARALTTPAAFPKGLLRLERRSGEVARLLLSLPAPDAADPDHPALRLLVAVLGSGRSSRLHRALVDEGQLCVGVSADLNEAIDPGAVTVSLEVLPSVDPARVEELLVAELERLTAEPPSSEELERARRMVLADWVFDHEKVHQQAFLVAAALALFDLEHPWRYFDRLLATTAADLPPLSERWLNPQQGAVLGWSLPAPDPEDPGRLETTGPGEKEDLELKAHPAG